MATLRISILLLKFITNMVSDITLILLPASPHDSSRKEHQSMSRGPAFVGIIQIRDALTPSPVDDTFEISGDFILHFASRFQISTAVTGLSRP